MMIFIEYIYDTFLNMYKNIYIKYVFKYRKWLVDYWKISKKFMLLFFVFLL